MHSRDKILIIGSASIGSSILGVKEKLGDIVDIEYVVDIKQTKISGIERTMPIAFEAPQIIEPLDVKYQRPTLSGKFTPKKKKRK